jgi:hypothetical protein
MRMHLVVAVGIGLGSERPDAGKRCRHESLDDLDPSRLLHRLRLAGFPQLDIAARLISSCRNDASRSIVVDAPPENPLTAREQSRRKRVARKSEPLASVEAERHGL